MDSPRARRQYRRSLAKDAKSAIPSAIRSIDSAERLDIFVDLVTLKPTIGSCVEVFVLDVQHEESFSVPQVRAALLLLPNVQDLLLFLPSPVPPELLADIRFRTLDYFATNIPHASLTAFLSGHSTLTSLILGPCGNSKGCPLSVVEIPDLMTLQCTTTCLDALPYLQVSRLTLDLPEAGGCMPTVLRAMPRPSSVLAFTSLTLDFRPDDLDILDTIIQAAPHVRKLKLVEKKNVTRRDNPGRRPWNHRSDWYRALCNLTLLEELAIVTLSPFITGEPGQEAEELRFVISWAGGCKRHGVVINPHPSLYHIMLRYGAQTRTTGALSHWSKVAGVWTRVVSVVGPADMES